MYSFFGLDHGVGHPSCLVILTLVVGFSGCAGISQTEQSALSGGAMGAVGGAWLGAMAGNTGMGAAIGGEGGLTGGYLSGTHTEAKQKASQ
jgi:osmotically inducible lipoprotein OsmB